MEFNLDKKINESLIRLTAVLILADGRTKNSEIEEAIYIINSVFNSVYQ